MMQSHSRLLLLGASLMTLVFSGICLGADFHLESKTLLQYFERDTSEKSDAAVVPGYQFLQFDYREDRVKGLSFHLHGWGRVDFADSGHFDDFSRGELVYGYLQYLSPDGPIHFRLGRTYVFEGVANDSIDGVEVGAVLDPNIAVSAYVGQPVSLVRDRGRSGDAIAGGRLAWRHMGYHEVGFSYQYVLSDGDRDEERAGIDLSLGLPWNLTLIGHSNWNFVSGEWAEHFYEGRWHYARFELRPFYHRFTLEGLFNEQDNSAPPFRVLAQLGGTTDIVGTEAYWYPSEAVEFGLRAKYYDYDQRFGNAWYASALMTYKWRIMNQVGAEFGRMQGDEDFNRFSLARGYIYYTLPRSFLTGDIFYTRYDEPIFNERNAFFASIGGGRKFLGDALSLKLSLGYSNDPWFSSDYRYTLVADYVFR